MTPPIQKFHHGGHRPQCCSWVVDDRSLCRSDRQSHDTRTRLKHSSVLSIGEQSRTYLGCTKDSVGDDARAYGIIACILASP